MNCSVWPTPRDATGGVTATATSTAGVTVRAAVPGMPDEVAVMVTAPVATPVARPWEPDALETVAVPFADDDQVTLSVRFCVVRLEYVPVAANCTVWPTPRDTTGGVTAMATSTAGVTVRAAVPGMSVTGSVAVMVTAPVATPVARPPEETVAVALLDDAQLTLSVILVVVRLE